MKYFMNFVQICSSIAVIRCVNGEQAPDRFTVTWGTNIQGSADGNTDLVVQFQRHLAPIGVDHVWHLIHDTEAATGSFYNNAAFFRAIPSFITQFGIAATPAQNQKWQQFIRDDPPNGVKNEIGTITYSNNNAEHTRSTQLFINTNNNEQLDGAEPTFIVIGQVLKGLDLVSSYVATFEQAVNQDWYKEGGNAWLLQHYPTISMITSTHIGDVYYGNANNADDNQQNGQEAAAAQEDEKVVQNDDDTAAALEEEVRLAELAAEKAQEEAMKAEAEARAVKLQKQEAARVMEEQKAMKKVEEEQKKKAEAEEPGLFSGFFGLF